MQQQKIKTADERMAENVARIEAHNRRLGISQPIARSVTELIEIEGKNPLIGEKTR